MKTNARKAKIAILILNHLNIQSVHFSKLLEQAQVFKEIKAAHSF